MRTITSFFIATVGLFAIFPVWADCMEDQWIRVCGNNNGADINVSVITGMAHDENIGHGRPIRQNERFMAELYIGHTKISSNETRTAPKNVRKNEMWDADVVSYNFSFNSPFGGQTQYVSFNAMSPNRQLWLVENQESGFMYLEQGDSEGHDPRLLFMVSPDGKIMNVLENAVINGWIPAYQNLARKRDYIASNPNTMFAQ